MPSPSHSIPEPHTARADATPAIVHAAQFAPTLMPSPLLPDAHADAAALPRRAPRLPSTTTWSSVIAPTAGPPIAPRRRKPRVPAADGSTAGSARSTAHGGAS